MSKAVEVRLHLLRIAEDHMGKKHVQYTATAYDEAGQDLGGIIGMSARLGDQITVLMRDDGRFAVAGSTIGIQPIDWGES